MTPDAAGGNYRVAVENEAERARESAVERAVEAERQRIARELHDVIAHSVSVMTVQAGAVRRLLRPDQAREREALLAVESTGRETLTELRRLVGLLRESESAELAPQPSLRALDILIGTAREAGLEVDLDVVGDERTLPPGVDLNAYRLLQEALAGVLRSPGQPRARVRVCWLDDALELEVESSDGLDGGTEECGQMLAGMQERVSLVGGRLETETRGGGGHVVRCHLPLERAA